MKPRLSFWSKKMKLSDILEFITLFELERLSEGIVEVKTENDILAVYHVYVMIYSAWEHYFKNGNV
jgi:hypothetical protein